MKRGYKFMATAMLTGGASLIMSLMNAILCTIALMLRWNCKIGELNRIKGSNFMNAMIYNQYVQDDICDSPLKMSGLTQTRTVFILTVTLLAFSIANILTSLGVMFASYQHRIFPYYVVVISYLHVAAGIAVIIVEITMGIHFGIDYGKMTRKMDEYSAGLNSNYTYDTLRHGTFFLMCLILKGFVAPAGNLFLLTMLVYFVHKDTDRRPREESPQHSIHSRGVINAFDRSKNEDSWQLQPEWTSTFVPGPNLNPAFVHDDGQERSPWEANPVSHFSSSRSSPYRTETHAPAYPGRPFTYLNRSPPSSSTRPAEGTRSQAPPPPVPIPAPDYSPRQKLRSALKTPYA